MMHDLIQGPQTISNSPASSFLVIDSADRSTATSTQGGQPLAIPITQPFNNFKLQKPQALLQGGFKSLKLTEVRFPYAMWNVITDVNDSFWATVDISGINTTAKITATGNFFYDGKALATEVAARLNSALSGAVWTVTYIQGGMVIAATGAGVNGFKLYPINPANIGVQPIDSRSLLDVLGFDPVTFWNSLTFGFPTLASNWAPLTYTSYIDFVSNNLTKYQEVSDSSSKTNSTGAVILRLFLNDETSTVPIKVYDASGVVVSSDFGNAGSFPFVIHRQFVCPKVFKWNIGASIDAIDLQLFDDKGLPFASDYINASLPNFQITFLATEE
jgi:hypothetical protein